MMMTPDVVKVVATPDFWIEAEFETGEKRRFDMRPYLKFPAYAELKEPGLFMCAHVENGTVAWREDIDLSPDTLYLRGVNSGGSILIAPGKAWKRGKNAK